MWYLYQITNRITQRKYYGITDDFHRRMEQHHSLRNASEKPLYKDMRVFGVENFDSAILQTFPTREEVIAKENELISLDVSCYNLMRPRLNKKNRVKVSKSLTLEEREIALERLNSCIDRMEIAEALKLMRQVCNMDQKTYANYTNVSKNIISKIETRKANPNLKVLNALGAPFGFRIGFQKVEDNF
jgi:group I intron endonuclease